jgi:transposase-like protein
MTENDKPPKKPSRASRLPSFFGEAVDIDINKMTVEEFLRCLNSRDFETYFERHFDRVKILNPLKAKAASFEKEILGRVFCPRSDCKSKDTVKVVDRKGVFKGYYRCQKCKEKFKPKRFIKSRFNDRTCALTLTNFAQGKYPRQSYQLQETERTSISLDYGVVERVPDEKTLYDILDKEAKKLEQFHELMIFLIGGIPCKVLYCDDAFAPKKQSKNQPKASKKKRMLKRFDYAIVTMDKDSRFILVLYIASFRDKRAFRYAFGLTEERLRDLPDFLKGDKLAAMEHAAPIFFPKDLVKHVFRRLKPWEKKELMRIERKIKDIRKTIPKRQKSGSSKVLRNLAIVSMCELNYLNPMEEALKGKTPAEVVGIPYPVYPHDWRKFMVWIDWLFCHLPEVLKAGLKQIPGSSLGPSSDESEELFRKKSKLKRL